MERIELLITSAEAPVARTARVRVSGRGRSIGVVDGRGRLLYLRVCANETVDPKGGCILNGP